MGGENTSLKKSALNFRENTIHAVQKFIFVQLKTFEKGSNTQGAIVVRRVVTGGNITAVGTVRN